LRNPASIIIFTLAFSVAMIMLFLCDSKIIVKVVKPLCKVRERLYTKTTSLDPHKPQSLVHMDALFNPDSGFSYLDT